MKKSTKRLALFLFAIPLLSTGCGKGIGYTVYTNNYNSLTFTTHLTKVNDKNYEYDLRVVNNGSNYVKFFEDQGIVFKNNKNEYEFIIKDGGSGSFSGFDKYIAPGEIVTYKATSRSLVADGAMHDYQKDSYIGTLIPRSSTEPLVVTYVGGNYKYSFNYEHNAIIHKDTNEFGYRPTYFKVAEVVYDEQTYALDCTLSSSVTGKEVYTFETAEELDISKIKKVSLMELYQDVTVKKVESQSNWRDTARSNMHRFFLVSIMILFGAGLIVAFIPLLIYFINQLIYALKRKKTHI